MSELDIFINDKPLSDFGGVSLLDYTVGAVTMDNQTFQGINRTTWFLLKSTFGLRSLTLTIVFFGRNLHEAKLLRSRFNGTVCGKCEIYIPDDGFRYTVSCKSLGDEEVVGIGDQSAAVKAQYEFEGIRHDKKYTVTVPVGGSLYCQSTMPFTDCRLTCTVSEDADSYELGGAVFADVDEGNVLCFDGIDYQITKNDEPCAESVSWVHFPSLTPGKNTFDAADPVTVEYYPTYI